MENDINNIEQPAVITKTEAYYLNILKNSDLCKYLDNQEIKMLITHNKITAFAPGEFIIKQGEKTEALYLILGGMVTMNARIMGQGITNIETLNIGNFFGEISFIEKGLCARSGLAKTEVQCLAITRSYFDYLAEYFPKIKYKILSAITEHVCNRLKRVHDKVTAFISSSDMISVSFFGKIIKSLTKPNKITFTDGGLAQLLDPLLLFFTKEERIELFKHLILLDAPKNCILMHEDEITPCCYIVIRGAVQSSIMQNNKIAKLSIIGPGKLFASIACVNSSPYFTVSFTTCERAILLKISATTLNFLRKHKSPLWYKLFDLICESLVALGKSIDKLDIRLNIETYNR